MKYYLVFFETSLHIAVENQNFEMVQLLLSNKKIDINAVFDVLNQFFRIY